MVETVTYCGCGCGGEIVPAAHHKYHPKTFLVGHARVAATKKFLQDNKNKHVCACGCGEFIEIRAIHKASTVGIPKFKPMHGGFAYAPRKESLTVKSENSRHRVGGRSKINEFTFWQRVKLLIRYNFSCAVCRYNKDIEMLQFDHILPVALGGKALLDNGQVLCPDCHAQKTYKEVSEFKYNMWRNVEHGKGCV